MPSSFCSLRAAKFITVAANNQAGYRGDNVLCHASSQNINQPFMYTALTSGFISQHTQVARLIIEAIAPAKLYLLGCSLAQVRTQSIFSTDASTARHVSHLYLLVLVNKSEAESCNAVQDKIENTCRSFIPVTAIVLPVPKFNEWLTKGHSFACKVYKFAECIHDTGNTTLATPAQVNEEERLKAIDACYKTGLNKVEEFLAGADLYRIREQNKMAAFMLHQAAEQALHTLLKITTGLHVVTHNIDKLVRYCSMVSYRLPAMFPRNNEGNERLFQVLQRAYIDSRYKEDYSIKTHDLLILTNRVKALEQLVKDHFPGKISSAALKNLSVGV